MLIASTSGGGAMSKIFGAFPFGPLLHDLTVLIDYAIPSALFSADRLY